MKAGEPTGCICPGGCSCTGITVEDTPTGMRVTHPDGTTVELVRVPPELHCGDDDGPALRAPRWLDTGDDDGPLEP